MSLFRLRRDSRPRRALPPPGVLRRERRALLELREEKLRDLGGLMLEMYRRDTFREHLVRERCEELLELDGRLAELESLLALARERLPPVRCECGAPLLPGSHFCANCGRPAGESVVGCGRCGHALPADAGFCPSCGARTVGEAREPAESVGAEAAEQGP